MSQKVDQQAKLRNSQTFTRHYDIFGRNVGYSVDGDRKRSITYSLSTGRIAESDGFRWEYLAGSNLKSKLTYPNEAIVTWSYEPHRDLLTAVTNATYSTYVYTNDLLGRRTSKNNEQYGYNVRDELTSANNVSHNYNDIVNRTTAEGRTYTANNLNQYTAIDDFTPQYDADGSQTFIKTSTGIWSVWYNAENRPIHWPQGSTTITLAFDRMGRRIEMRTQSVDSDLLQRFVCDNYLCIQRLRREHHAITTGLIPSLWVWGYKSRCKMICCFLVFISGCFLFCGCRNFSAKEEVITAKSSYVSMIATIDDTALLKTKYRDYDLQGTISFLDLLAKVKELERERAFILSDGNGRFYWLSPEAKRQHGTLPDHLSKVCGISSLLNTTSSGICILSEKPKYRYSVSLAITILLWPWHIENNESAEIKRGALETMASPFLYPRNTPLAAPFGKIAGVLLMDSFEDSFYYTGKNELKRIFENGLSDSEKTAIKAIIQDPDWKVQMILALLNVRLPI